MNTWSNRFHFLPCYPKSLTMKMDDDLLFTNVSSQDLNKENLLQRQLYGYYRPMTYRNHHEQWIDQLSQTWNIHPTIVEYNFQKLLTMIDQMAYKRMYHFATNVQEEMLHEDEYKIALEFYLQFDVDVFYMKTCSYRGAQSVINDPKSIFSTNERPPYGRYTMDACHLKSCSLCYPSLRMEFQSTIQHTFVNGYRSILNCPATCTTRNIIYVLTCPCKQFDYVGETSLSLSQRLVYHRRHANRIMREYLFGKKLTDFVNQGTIKSYETLVKDGMHLYQHLCRCPIAMQKFLTEYPDYWCFIPQRLTEHEEYQQERDLLTPLQLESLPHVHLLSEPVDRNYHFTIEQKKKIEAFFQQKKHLGPFNSHFNFYEASIVAVLPENASSVLRRFVEMLFITQAETKLNTFRHVDLDHVAVPRASTTELSYETLVRPFV